MQPGDTCSLPLCSKQATPRGETGSPPSPVSHEGSGDDELRVSKSAASAKVGARVASAGSGTGVKRASNTSSHEGKVRRSEERTQVQTQAATGVVAIEDTKVRPTTSEMLVEWT